MPNLSKALNEEADKLMLAQRQGISMKNMLTTLKNLGLFDMVSFIFCRMDDGEWRNMGAPDADFIMRITWRDEDNKYHQHNRCL